MVRRAFWLRNGLQIACIALAFVTAAGCQSLKYWWHNDLKVGPNYCTPAAMIADDFRMVDHEGVDGGTVIDAQWWHVFQDPALDQLIQQAYQQNVSLKIAAWRIEEARAIRRIAAANLLPQSQTAFSQYAHTQNSRTAGNAFPGLPVTVDDWSLGFDAGWEIDLWGRIRRNIAAADAQWCAAIKDYDFALVSLFGEVASVYIQIRAADERIELARKNVTLQQGSLDVATIRFEEGRTSKLDVVQAEANLAATQSLIPQLELARQQLQNALAVLLGTPPSEFDVLPPGRIPDIPAEVIVGIPAELVLRRPDIRAAERIMAAQFEQIGIAEADLYPTFTFGGTLGLQSARVSTLFDGRSFTGSVVPAFRWNVLNYGRLQEAIRVERARYQQVQWDFQNAVLSAQREAEDGIVEFIKAQEQFEFASQQVDANAEAAELGMSLYKEGKQDFGRVFVVESSLVLSQDQLVALKGNIALALVNTYRALGGGWEVRMSGGPTMAVEMIEFPMLDANGVPIDMGPLSQGNIVDEALEMVPSDTAMPLSIEPALTLPVE